MQKLTNKEEEIMHILWKLEKAFVKDILAEINEDQPHYNTLSTIVRNLEDKGYVDHVAYGKTHQYFPIIKKEDYRKRFFNTAIDNYFNSSYKNVVSFFAKEVPGLFFNIGGAPKGVKIEDTAPHHTPDFYVDDAGLKTGIKAFLNLINDYSALNKK